ncbi:MAG: hypothetical protein GY832_36390 [Chloroflexi bacterium]|nr:hypothetical protein [Chloroflexota bacterium]
MQTEKKSYRQTILWGLVLCLSFSGLVGCKSAVEKQVGPQAVDPATQPPRQTVTLDSIEVYKVILDRPLNRPDVNGEDRTWEEAFMVRIGITEPPAAGPKFDVFLDEERVTEFGGWEGGIYFWVYDPARLKMLEGRTISYQFDRSERYEIGMLALGNQQEFRQVREEELREQ